MGSGPLLRKLYLYAMEKEPGQPEKPKKAQKKKVDYNSENIIFKSSKDRLKYFYLTNNKIQYSIALLIRAELHKRGLTVRGLVILLSEQGFKVSVGTLTSFLQGKSNRWSLGQLYFSAYVLGIDLNFKKIEEARSYLLASGRSVKEL